MNLVMLVSADFIFFVGADEVFIGDYTCFSDVICQVSLLSDQTVDDFRLEKASSNYDWHLHAGCCNILQTKR